MEYTKGEWEVYEAIESPNRKSVIAEINATPFKKYEVIADYCNKSDAHLIAAAPDMYEALKVMLFVFKGEHVKACDQARQALSKAEGVENG